MKVKDLIEELQKVDPELEVFIPELSEYTTHAEYEYIEPTALIVRRKKLFIE